MSTELDKSASREDIEKYFTERNLASLSLDDYILLLKRFSSEMVTHSTRQGIRDHTGHAFHTKGVGEYSDDFIRILADGRLRSPLGVYLKEGLKEEAVKDFMTKYLFDGIWPPKKELALADLDNFINPKYDDPNYYHPYSDRTAIHVATEEVADEYYGSERGNEIFIAFPSVLIASQYFFYGQLTEPGDNVHNDQWVWTDQENGLDINTGLVFIPEEARVDPRTGSRYKLGTYNNPIVNQVYVDKIKELAESAEFGELAKQIEAIISSSKWNYNIAHAEWLGWPPETQQLYRELEPVRQILEQQFEITDRRLQTVMLDWHNLARLKEDTNSHFDEKIREILESQSILYVEAETTISSKDFWENYFAQHPDQRPSKIVYYKGVDPTAALSEWKKSHGITKLSQNRDLGFWERYVRPNSIQATVSLSRFRQVAEEVIEKYFSSIPNGF